MVNDKLSMTKETLQRLAFAGVLLSLLYRWWAHSLVSQMEMPVLVYPYVDLTYWGLHFSGLIHWISNNYAVAIGFDVLLIGTALGSFVFTRYRIFPILFTLLYVVYFVSYNSYGAHHTHCMVGVLLIGVPFWFRHQKTYELLWEGLRYFALWVYASAFLWKLLRGSWFNFEQGAAVFMNENATHIALNPDAWMTGVYAFFITHPLLSFLANFVVVSIEGLFIIGFFTKKYDWAWIILPVIFHTMTYLFVHVMFYELLILNLAFLPIKKNVETRQIASLR